MKLLNQYTPRILIYVLDLCICAFSLILAYTLRFEISYFSFDLIYSLRYPFLLVLATRGLLQFFFRTYSGIIRYASTQDAERILVTTTLGFAILFLFSTLFSYLEVLVIPRSVLLIEYIATSLLMISFRIVVKAFYGFIITDAGQARTVIIGSEQDVLRIKRALDADLQSNIQIVGLFCTTRRTKGLRLENIPIYSIHRLSSVLQQLHVQKLIMTDEIAERPLREKIYDTCIRAQVNVLSAPDVRKWLEGQIAFQSVKQININDLLFREPIALSTQKIETYLRDKVILITGAAGSIGSELVRQVLRFAPREVILFDQAETPLYDIELELREVHHYTAFRIILGNITDSARVREAFEHYKPEVVFHAAAYKHVPMLEEHPYEAVANNVWGTKILADLAHEYGVKRFVMVSTDKAVRPSNVMGASKRICELYVQMLAQQSTTRFIITRFGNVLGSNGSVILRFQHQIETGGPVTITHPEIRRYFMTIPEACQLVLEAGTMGEGGEIFVFDLGHDEKIIDLAEKMILLSGYVPYRDIKIVTVGLRPGEKLYEEMLNVSENTIPTYHPKILRAKETSEEPVHLRPLFEDLRLATETLDDFAIVRTMKRLVPEFVSQNSCFERLDHE